MRIGLYGGSFDPVHLGHLLVARAALEELSLDRLLFIPAARSPFKPEVAPAPDALRLRMLRLALAGENRMAVDDREIHRGGVSYSVDTVRELRATGPAEAVWFWLIGSDHLRTLSQWKESAALASLVEFVVIPRPGGAASGMPPPYRVHQLRGWPLQVSSSEIRERAARGQSLRHLVPGPVAEVLTAEALYRNQP